MLVELEDDVFRLATDAERRRLIGLFQHAEDRGHFVYHTQGDSWPADSFVEKALSSAMFSDRDRDWIKGALDDGLLAANRPNASRRKIRAHVGATSWLENPPVLSLADAVEYLAYPIPVLVEDQESDALFLQCWVPAARALDLHEAIRLRNLGFEHGGGITNIPRRLNGAVTKNDESFLHRVVVLFDSDAAEPCQPSTHANKCVEACEKLHPAERDSRFHCLERRAIENYLPHDVLDKFLSDADANVHPDIVSALRKLGATSVYAKHYHMKNGLIADIGVRKKKLYKAEGNRRWDPTDIEDLPAHWRAIPTELFPPLLRGFSEKLAAMCTSEMQKRREEGTPYRFDDEAQKEAELVFSKILSWV